MDVSDVTDLPRIWSLCNKLTIKCICYDAIRFAAVAVLRSFIPALRFQTCMTHQPQYSISTRGSATFKQILVDVSIAAMPQALQLGLLYLAPKLRLGAFVQTERRLKQSSLPLGYICKTRHSRRTDYWLLRDFMNGKHSLTRDKEHYGFHRVPSLAEFVSASCCV